MKVKLISLMFVGILAGSLLVGCGNTDNTNNSSDVENSVEADGQETNVSNVESTYSPDRITGDASVSGEGLDEEAAKKVAFEHAGVNAEDVKEVSVESTESDYTIYFETEEWAYEYNLMKTNGAITYSDQVNK